MRLKRLTAILLCLCMALTLLPTAALAAAVGETIHVGGVALTSTEATPTVYARTVGGAVTTGGASATDYNIMWDGTTLTLNGATITQGSHENAAIYYHDRYTAIHLVLMGESTVTGPSGDSTGASYGIYTGGELTISGSGILNVSGGILNVSGGDIAASSNGLFVNGNLTISGGTVHATGGEVSGEYAYSFGINAENVTVSGGTVHATGGEVSGEYAYSFGIYVTRETLAISGGIVNADGGTATGSYAESCGIYVTHGLTISGGIVNADGGEVSGNNAYSYGICATHGLTISGGEVTAEGATQAVRSFMGAVTVAPAGGEQIEVTAGAGKDSAAAIIGSPFTSEEEISDSSISSAKYFHSIAEAAEGPGSGERGW